MTFKEKCDMTTRADWGISLSRNVLNRVNEEKTALTKDEEKDAFVLQTEN